MTPQECRQSRDRRVLIQQLSQLVDQTALQSLDEYLQHGQTSCLEHSLGVAYYSLCLANRLKLRCNRKSMVLGALLHDYFLYDWHEVKLSQWHGFHHADIALTNARAVVDLTPRECDVIQRHMFPLTKTPPKYRESALVCVADKYCTLREMLCKQPYRHFLADLREQLAQGVKEPS